MRYYIESKWRASMIEQEAIALQEHKNPAWYWDNEIHDLLTDTPKKKRKQHCLMILRWYRLWIIIDLLKLWPKLKFNFFLRFVGLATFAIVLQSKCKAQYQQWHQALQDLHKGSRRLIACGRCLCWSWWILFNFCRESGGVNLPNKVFFHHLHCWVTVANIFKIGGGILLCVNTRRFLAYVLFS